MTSLVLLAHDATGIKQPSRSAIAAATKLATYNALITGKDVAAAAAAAAKLPGVSKVLVADGDDYANPLAEKLAALILALAPGYTHLPGARHRVRQERDAARGRVPGQPAD